MKDPVLVALIGSGTAGTIVASVLSYLLGTRRTRVEARQVDTAEDSLALAAWEKLAREYADDRTRVQRELAELRADVDQMRITIRRLEAERDADRQWKRLAIDYIRTLLGVLHTADLATPPPPPGLDEGVEPPFTRRDASIRSG